MSKVLRVTEYQSIRAAETFSAADRTVTQAQFQQIERFNGRFEKLRKVRVFQYGPRNTLVAQNFVGVINLGPYQIEVLPKIEAKEHRVRQNLLQMVATTLNLKLHAGALGLMERTDQSILEVLIRLYCDLLWEALHKGMVRRYESQQDNLGVLRGRLNVLQQLRHNLARPDRLQCTFDEFTADNELNRSLKASLKILHNVSRSEASTRGISELLFCFDEVGDVPANSIQWERVTINRLSERYAPLVRMAKMFIEGSSPDLTSGSRDGFAILFDMNQLFEEYVGREVKRINSARGIHTVLQGPKRHLALNAGGAPCFALRPDIVSFEKEGRAVVIDTKWKRLKVSGRREAISSADLYQMFAYSRQYQAQHVILLYPHHPELGVWKPLLNTYLFENPEKDQKKQVLHTSSIQLDDLKLVRAQLESILAQAVQEIDSVEVQPQVA